MILDALEEDIKKANVGKLIDLTTIKIKIGLFSASQM